jgi:hypothetical protein
MTVDMANERFRDLPDTQNIAHSHFGFAGTITAKQIRSAIATKPGNDHVLLIGYVDKPEIHVCAWAELGKFFCG